MTELKLPRLHRGTKGAELSDTGDPAASEQTATSFEPTGTKKTYYRDNDPSDKCMSLNLTLFHHPLAVSKLKEII